MNLKRAILRTLNLSQPYMVPQVTLRSETEVSFGGLVGDTDFTAAIAELEQKGMIGHAVDPISSDKKYFITEAGKGALRQ